MHPRQKTVRRCSLCRQTGHTKQHCSQHLRQTNKHKNTSSSVFVSVHTEASPSPHVVDLRSEETRGERPVFPLFQENNISVPEWVPLDLAAIVRKANATALSSGMILPTRQALLPKVSKVEPKIGLVKPRVSLALRAGRVSSRIRSCLTGIAGNIQDSGEYIREQSTTIVRACTSRVRLVHLAVVLLMVGLPFPTVAYYKSLMVTGQQVYESGTQGFFSLQSSTIAALGADLNGAERDLSQALASFATANSLLEREHRVLQSITAALPVVGGQFESRRNILQAGQHIALGNAYLIKGVEEASITSTPMTDRLTVLRQHIRSTIPQYQAALDTLHHVETHTLPVEFQGSFDELKFLATAVIDDMNDLVDLMDALSVIFGQDEFRRYLVVFQNNSELRATGGFVGSFAIVDVQKGKILNIDVPGGGSYDLQGQLDVFEKPPVPLQLVNGRWEFQDANWWPHFPASAEKLAWFYRHARGSSVDGVIALNASVLERFLSVMGPVANEEHAVVLDAASAVDTLQYKVEYDFDTASNTPKEIIGDVMSDFLSLTQHADKIDLIKLVVALHEAAQEKEIQVYMNDQTLEQQMREFGWTGELFDTAPPQDYLMVVGSNVQGQKSDAKIEQDIEHTVVIEPDGTATVHVTVRRTHGGQAGELFYGGPNISYVRLYVPKGAELLDAGGFTYPPEDAFHVPEPWYVEDEDVSLYEKEVGIETKTGTQILESFGKTAFGNWMATAPGSTSEAFVVYRLPFRIPIQEVTKTARWFAVGSGQPHQTSRYSFVAQKQSGTNSHLVSTVVYPDGWEPVWRSDDTIQLTSSGVVVDQRLETDASFGVVMEHKH